MTSECWDSGPRTEQLLITDSLSVLTVQVRPTAQQMLAVIDMSYTDSVIVQGGVWEQR